MSVPGAACWGSSRAAERVEAARELVGKRLERPAASSSARAMRRRWGWKDGSLDWVCGDVPHHIRHGQGAVRVPPRRPARRPRRHQGVAGAVGDVPAGLPGAQAPHPARRDRALARRGAAGRSRSAGRPRGLPAHGGARGYRRAHLSDRAARPSPPPPASTSRARSSTATGASGRARSCPPRTGRCAWAVASRGSPRNVLASPDYYCLYPITICDGPRSPTALSIPPANVALYGVRCCIMNGVPEERCNGRRRSASARLGRCRQRRSRTLSFTERRA